MDVICTGFFFGVGIAHTSSEWRSVITTTTRLLGAVLCRRSNVYMAIIISSLPLPGQVSGVAIVSYSLVCVRIRCSQS